MNRDHLSRLDARIRVCSGCDAATLEKSGICLWCQAVQS